MPSPMTHRESVYLSLRGHGLEIGALHEPAPVPGATKITYYDTRRKAESVALFPEIPAERIVDPEFVGNLDVDGLRCFADATFDFVIISHVIEHLSNPVLAIREVFRVTKPLGHVVIAVPDKNFTFDRLRPSVSWAHLWDDYLQARTVSSDEHYIEFLKSAHADVFPELEKNLAHHVARVRSRCEHTHAWDSAVFRQILGSALDHLRISARPVHEWNGAQTQLEYFSLWQKTA